MKFDFSRFSNILIAAFVFISVPITVTAFDQLKDKEGFLISSRGYPFEFPRDHGSHPGFKIEWWYLTGNLESDTGEEFGYQLTIFRNQLVTDEHSDKPDSSLTLDQLYLGHFAISNIDQEEHREQMALAREALGGTYASETAMDIQLNDWKIIQKQDETISIEASSSKGFSLALDMKPDRPFVIHGEDGIHLKTNNEQNASHYISYTRLDSSGSVNWDGNEYDVKGLSWMDHEFGSSWLDSDDEGWDWMAIQLENGIDLMIYRIRRTDGSPNPYAVGSLVTGDGDLIKLPFSDYEMNPARFWKSSESNAEYPVEWAVTIPGYDSSLKIEAAFDDQENNFGGDDAASTYYEGAIRVSGTWEGKLTSGKGYMELVGYKQAMDQLSSSE